LGAGGTNQGESDEKVNHDHVVMNS
jgi:hypothetical protein